MAEASRFWTTNGTGDGSGSGYSAANFNQFVREAFITDPTAEGVLRGIGNNLAVTGTVSPVSTNTGAALVYGFFYSSDSAVTTVIPTPAGSTRVDRIVLRVSWAAQTVRITRIAGTEGAGVPALTQVANTTWDIPLANVSITTGGVITVTDQRTYVKSPGVYGWLDENVNITGTLTVSGVITPSAGLSAASVATAAIQDNAITTAKILDGQVTAAKIANDTITASQIAANAITSSELADNSVDAAALQSDAVTTAKILDANVTTAKIANLAVTAAKIANDTITAAQIAADAIGASELANNAVDTAAIVDAAVTTAKIADANVTLAKLAADSVDDTKAGDRVPQVYRRQGGSATIWNSSGTSTQTPGAVRMQPGSAQITTGTVAGGSLNITFSHLFAYAPIVYATLIDPGGVGQPIVLHVKNVTTGGFTVDWFTSTLVALGVSVNITVGWLAIGPE